MKLLTLIQFLLGKAFWLKPLLKLLRKMQKLLLQKQKLLLLRLWQKLLKPLQKQIHYHEH